MNQFTVNRMAKYIYKGNCYNAGIQCMLDAFCVPSHHIIHNFSSPLPLPLPAESTPRFVIRPRPGTGAGGAGFGGKVDEYLPPPEDFNGGLGGHVPPLEDFNGGLGLTEPHDPK